MSHAFLEIASVLAAAGLAIDPIKRLRADGLSFKSRSWKGVTAIAVWLGTMELYWFGQKDAIIVSTIAGIVALYECIPPTLMRMAERGRQRQAARKGL
jgi:hypothetical protein